MDQNDNIQAIDSIVKARDDNTTDSNKYPDSYLYNMMLSHIEHIQTNLYNFKFIARILTPESSQEIYLNLGLLINDSSIVNNSKYFIEDKDRLKLVNSYRFGDKENKDNSYRIDLSMNPSKEEDDPYLKLELVNIASNTSHFANINKEIFFKISVFLYQLLNNNIIDGIIFNTHLDSFRLLVGKEALLSSITSDTKLFTLYWNNRYIVCFLEKTTSNGFSHMQVTYACFTREEFENLMI